MILSCSSIGMVSNLRLIEVGVFSLMGIVACALNLWLGD